MAINAATALQAYMNAARVGAGAGGDATGGTGGTSFSSLVAEALGDGVAQTRAGEQAIADAAQGRGELVDVVTAIAEAEATLETIVTVRDRVINAYQEVMKMPI